MADEGPQRSEWQLDPDAEAELRAGLPELAPELRAELWWWMAQRGKPGPPAERPSLAGLDPGTEVIIEHIRSNPVARHRQSDWLLATYAVLTRREKQGEWLYASRTGVVNQAAKDAFRDIHLPAWWRESLVGNAVFSVGIAGRLDL